MAARKKKKNTKKQDQSFLKSEIAVILLFAISALLFLSNFGICGFVGSFFKGIQTGLFGIVGYLFPIFLFFISLFGMSNKGNVKAKLKIVAVILAILSICAMIHLFWGKEATSADAVLEYYSSGKAGGVIGTAIATLFGSVLGKIGTFLILLVVLIISIVCITERSFVSFVKKGSSKAYMHAKEDAHRLQEGAKKAAQERKKIKDEKKALGIDLAATNLNEVSPDTAVDNYADDFKTPDDMVNPADVFSGSIYNSNIDNDVPFDEDDKNLTAGFGDELDNALKKADQILTEERCDNKEYPDPTKDAYYQGTLDDTDSSDVENILTSADGERTIVTASGKVIEADTDAVIKKMSSAQRETAVGEVKEEIKQKEKKERPYIFPSLNLLVKGKKTGKGFSDKEYKETAIKLQQTLKNFGVAVTVTNISCGPAVTRYELHPEQGVKVSKIVSLTDDIKLSLAASDIRIEAPIPGKSAIGIEVPNKENNMVYLRDLLESHEFKDNEFKIAFAVGKDIGGQIVVTDIDKMPHLLIAGATGSGKSVCINTLIMSIIYKYAPKDVKMIMVDPKVVELSIYNGIPHLLIPVVTDPKKAAAALNWAVAEMTDRYKKFADSGVRDLKGYNQKVFDDEKMSQIVIIIDELADLMMVAQNEVEDAICRLAQLARAAGIHLVIATQRPSVNVITGLIKANIPSRIAFAVTSGVDSRTILDSVGAEKLLGKGDMLFDPQGSPKPMRIQGAYVSDNEVQRVVDFLLKQGSGNSYDTDMENKISSGSINTGAAGASTASDRDELFAQAGEYIIDKDKASIGNLQRIFKIGFNRAARIMDQLCEAGVVGEENGTKPREVLMTKEEFEEILR